MGFSSSPIPRWTSIFGFMCKTLIPWDSSYWFPPRRFLIGNGGRQRSCPSSGREWNTPSVTSGGRIFYHRHASSASFQRDCCGKSAGISAGNSRQSQFFGNDTSGWNSVRTVRWISSLRLFEFWSKFAFVILTIALQAVFFSKTERHFERF